MSNANGYLKLHRSLLDWEWYDDDACLRLFIHLLLRVNYLPGKFKGMDVPPGTLVTSTDRLSESLGWSRSKLRRTLDKLKSGHDIETKAASNFTAITLVNWAKYQNDEENPTSNRPANRPAIGQQVNTEPTSNRPTDEHTTGHNRRREESNKGRREEGKKNTGEAPVLLSVPKVEVIPTGVSVTLWEAIKRWEHYRVEARAKLTTTGKQAMIKKCIEMGEQRAIAAIDHSMANGWKGLFEPQQQRTNGTAGQSIADKASGALEILRSGGF